MKKAENIVPMKGLLGSLIAAYQKLSCLVLPATSAHTDWFLVYGQRRNLSCGCEQIYIGFREWAIIQSCPEDGFEG